MVELRHIGTWALAGIVTFVMVGGGVAHLTAPAQFIPLVPQFLPAGPILAITGVVQLVIGLAVLWPAWRRWAGLAFAMLCLGYLPLHLWDYIRPDPVFAPPVAATVRVAVQLVFVWIGLHLWRQKA